VVYLVESGAAGDLCCAAGVCAFGVVHDFRLAGEVCSGGELVASLEGGEDAGLKPGATFEDEDAGLKPGATGAVDAAQYKRE